MRTQIATEQEKLLTEKEQELERIRQDLASTKDDLSQKTEEVGLRTVRAIPWCIRRIFMHGQSCSVLFWVRPAITELGRDFGSYCIIDQQRVRLVYKNAKIKNFAF